MFSFSKTSEYKVTHTRRIPSSTHFTGREWQGERWSGTGPLFALSLAIEGDGPRQATCWVHVRTKVAFLVSEDDKAFTQCRQYATRRCQYFVEGGLKGIPQIFTPRQLHWGGNSFNHKK